MWLPGREHIPIHQQLLECWFRSPPAQNVVEQCRQCRTAGHGVSEDSRNSRCVLSKGQAVAVDVVSVLVKVVDLVSVLEALLIRRFLRAHQTGQCVCEQAAAIVCVCVCVWTHESACVSVRVRTSGVFVCLYLWLH